MNKRIFYGFFLFLIGIISIYLGGIFTFLWSLSISLFILYEMFRMKWAVGNRLGLAGLIISVLGVNLGVYFTSLTLFFRSSSMMILLVVFLLVCLLEIVMKNVFFVQHSIVYFFRIFCMLSITLPYIYLIRSFENGMVYLFYIIWMVASSDTFAYYGGKCFGKHQLSSISPNKTIEGSLFGILGCLFISLVFVYFLKLTLVLYLGIGFVIAVLAQLGDLHESLIKRCFNVKDSSDFIPGHGGFYDRSDSYLFVLPVVFFMFNNL